MTELFAEHWIMFLGLFVGLWVMRLGTNMDGKDGDHEEAD